MVRSLGLIRKVTGGLAGKTHRMFRSNRARLSSSCAMEPPRSSAKCSAPEGKPLGNLLSQVLNAYSLPDTTTPSGIFSFEVMVEPLPSMLDRDVLVLTVVVVVVLRDVVLRNVVLEVGVLVAAASDLGVLSIALLSNACILQPTNSGIVISATKINRLDAISRMTYPLYYLSLDTSPLKPYQI